MQVTALFFAPRAHSAGPTSRLRSKTALTQDLGPVRPGNIPTILDLLYYNIYS